MTSHRALALALCSLTLTACANDEARPDAPPTAPARPEASAAAPPLSHEQAAEHFAATVETIYQARLAAQPAWAVELGLHDYDGKVPAVDDAAIEREKADLKRFIAELEGTDPAMLPDTQRIEREVVLTQLRSDLFQLEDLDVMHTTPLAYSLDVSGYISRDYAPLSARARAIIAVCNQSEAYYAAAKKNLAGPLHKTHVKVALMMAKGTIKFLRDDVKVAMAGLTDAGEKAALDRALDKMAGVLADFAEFLEEKQKTADDDFALGPARFMKMLRVQNQLDIDLASLKKVAEADLARNLARMDAAAKAIDPNKSTAEVVAQVMNAKPAADAVLQLAQTQCADLKQHLEKNAVVSIPFKDEAKVVETPPFLRFNFAFLDGAGPFEQKKLPSFYYITPPDPSWPEDKQRAYVPGETDLLGTSIHEVWPGHFLHGLHKKKLRSKILKSYWNYAMGEGWAHYAEEMMVTDAGYRRDDPAVQVGMLINALLRDVRFLAAIGLHCEGMGVDEAFQMFKDKAFQDDGNAQQQAVRGTFDPMYLSYTLGKLMIKKLRADYRAKMGAAFSLKDFHDRFLSFGSAPVPVIRRAMLGPDAGPAL